MVFFEESTTIGLILSALPALASIYFYLVKDKKELAIFLLLSSAFLLRILMISLDPYVHEWDERFHALVAKHMMEQPFKPMLFLRHILPFNDEDWGYNHIWVHKQPLFLWQMALSMKIFGINTFALRLPSAILGTVMVWLTYDISRKWIPNTTVAFLSAFLSAFAYYALELISGWISLEHNDLAFVFYMTCTFWAFTKYLASENKMKWAVWIGVFAGMAILNKWLVGLLIFGGWGLYLLLSEYRKELKYYAQYVVGVIVTCIVFLPWQIYIRRVFPVESAIAYEYNRKHMTEALGHPGGALFHIQFLPTAYHPVLLIFLILGVIAVLFSKTADKKLSLSFMAMIAVLLTFFSFFVATKMPAFIYPVSSLLIILMAYGAISICTSFFDYLKLASDHRNQLFCFLVIGLGFYSLKPNAIISQRAEDNLARNNKIQNSTAFKQLDPLVVKDWVILNCRAYENIELMFYQDVLAYHWYPTEGQLDSLQNKGYKFAAFQYLNDQQQLPGYIVEDKEILILPQALK